MKMRVTQLPSGARAREEIHSAGARSYPLAIRTEHMLVMVVVLVGLTLASSSELHKGAGLSRDVFYEIGGAGLLMAGIVIGCLQRLWKLHILLTPTEIVVPTAPASRTMMAIPRSSIITCEIVPVARWSRALVVYHHRGQLRLGDFRLPSSAALDEIYETLLTGRERQSSETEPRERRATDSASSPGAVLELKYSDYINWPALIAVSIIGSILGFGALDPSRNAPAAVRWSMAAFVGLFVVVWSVVLLGAIAGAVVFWPKDPPPVVPPKLAGPPVTPPTQVPEPPVIPAAQA